MDLKSALTKVIRFAAKGKDAPERLMFVRLFPASASYPASVYTTDGVVGNLIEVDQDIPNTMIPVRHVAPITKGKSTYTGWAIDPMNRVMKITTDAGETLTVQTKDPTEFPGLPAFPKTYRKIESWGLVHKVIHAAAAYDLEAKFECIHFMPNYVEASDRYRAARADVACIPARDRPALVPAQLFKYRPKRGPVRVGFTLDHIFFRIGDDEIRFTKLVEADRFQTDTIFDQPLHTHHSVEVKPFLLAIQDAVRLIGADASPAVALGFTPGEVEVRSWAPGLEQEYRKTMEATSQLNGTGSVNVLVDGKMLIASLKEIDTPRVRLCYGAGVSDPLRLESGAYRECLWPMLARNNRGSA